MRIALFNPKSQSRSIADLNRVMAGRSSTDPFASRRIAASHARLRRASRYRRQVES